MKEKGAGERRGRHPTASGINFIVRFHNPLELIHYLYHLISKLMETNNLLLIYTTVVRDQEESSIWLCVLKYAPVTRISPNGVIWNPHPLQPLVSCI